MMATFATACCLVARGNVVWLPCLLLRMWLLLLLMMV